MLKKELNDHKDDLKDYLFLSEEGKDMPEMLKALCSQAKEEYKNFSDNIDIIGKKFWARAGDLCDLGHKGRR